MTDTSSPAQWLIREYEATDPAGIPPPDEVADWDFPTAGSVTIQPMLAFKDVMDSGQAMHVIPGDYLDPVRWWL